MAKFNFYQDRKVTSWERDTFTVEADDYRAAVDIVRSWQGQDISTVSDECLQIDECRSLWETSVNISPEDNGGKATLIVYDACDAEVMTNGATLRYCENG